MDFSFIIHVGIISAALLIGSFLRSRIRLFQRFLIPAPIIAGAFLLIFYNYAAPHFSLTQDFLDDLVYHLLNVSFIAMMLRVPDPEQKKSSKRILAGNTFALISQYGFQAFFGFLLTLVIINTFMPSLNPAFGATLPLGFELGPGQAYSMSSVWESMGFEGAGSVGLTMAAIGFLVGSVGGVILINRALKRGWIDQKYADKIRERSVRVGFSDKKGAERTVGSYITTEGESIDSLTYHTALVAITYLISWGFLTGLEWLLTTLAGNLGQTLATSLWGVNFIISMFCAVIVRKVMTAFGFHKTVDNHTMNRISGIAVDFTVASSLGAISIAAIAGYWLPILLLTIVGILITCFFLPWYCSRIFDDHQFFRTLMIFGTGTGTLPTALSLLRVVDPEFETPVATDFIYANGVMFFLAIPLILCINLPALSVQQNNPALFYIMLGLCALYCIVAMVGYCIIAGKRRFAQRGKFFYVPEKN